MILTLIDEAVAAGARLSRACAVFQLTTRTVQRWREQGPQGGDDRRHGPRTRPHNKLSEAERRRVLKVINSEPYRDLSVKQIVPRLCDQGVYLASESTMCRILEQEGLDAHRQPSKPRKHSRPQQHIATGPSQLLCWDITYPPSTVRGEFFYLHLFLDVWSRKIVDWGVRKRARNADLDPDRASLRCFRQSKAPLSASKPDRNASIFMRRSSSS